MSSRRDGVYGHVTKGIAKGVEEKSGARPTTKSAGALWRGHSRGGMPAGAGVVYKGSNSVVCGV